MSIYVNVVNQKMHISSTMDCIVAGSQEFVKFKFNLSEEWDGLKTFAQFSQKGVGYNQYLDDENCVYLPAEIDVGTCTLMLYGSYDTVIATTNYLTLKIGENGLISDAKSTDISTSLYNQLITQLDAIIAGTELTTVSAGVENDVLYVGTSTKSAEAAIKTANYGYFTVEVVEKGVLPDVGDPYTFYLVPKADVGGYDKYWYVDGQWDTFSDKEEVAKLTEDIQNIENKESRNKFDYADSSNLLNIYYSSTFTASENAKTLAVECYPNCTYTISKIKSARFAVGSCAEYPAIGLVTNTYNADNDATELTITTGAEDAYLWCYYYNKTDDVLAEKDILKSIQIEIGIKSTKYIPNKIVNTRDESLSNSLRKLIVKNEESQWIPFNFSNAKQNCIEIPSGVTDIGMISVMDVRNVLKNPIDNLYAWCSPHDYPGGIYLYTAPHPLGKWTCRGLMFSVEDFAPNDTLSTRHVSSPDVIWDKDLFLDNEYGGFRIYFHYHGGYLDEREQRTYLAFSKDGLTLHSFYEHNNYASPIIPKPKNEFAIDADYDSYARFIKKGHTWLSFFSAGHEGYGTGIGVAKSIDNGYTFTTQKDFFLPPLKNDGGYTGIPSILEYDDIIYMTYFSYEGDKGQINLAEIHEDGSIIRRGKILAPSDNGWDNFRTAESYLLIYEDNLYLFYSGRDDREGHEQGKWSDTLIGVTMCKRGLK